MDYGPLHDFSYIWTYWEIRRYLIVDGTHGTSQHHVQTPPHSSSLINDLYLFSFSSFSSVFFFCGDSCGGFKSSILYFSMANPKKSITSGQL